MRWTNLRNRLRDADKYLHIQAFIAKFVVKTLPERILPGTAGINVMGVHALFGQPCLNGFGHKLWAVVAAKIGRETVLRERTLEHSDYGLGCRGD